MIRSEKEFEKVSSGDVLMCGLEGSRLDESAKHTYRDFWPLPTLG